MNQQHKDIITAIGRKQPITTADIAEYLMDHFGYGGGMEFDAFRDQVSKTIGYLKSKGEIVGYDAPQEKGKPLRHWLLPNPQPERHDEMASDVAEVEATCKESLTVAYVPGSFDDPTVNPAFFGSKPNESIVETRESDADANPDDASQAAAADAVPLSDPTEAQAGRASEAAEHFREVLGIPVQARYEAKASKPATMPVGIAIAEFGSYSWKEGTTLAEVFMCGIAYAEEYHKIGPNENGDYL